MILSYIFLQADYVLCEPKCYLWLCAPHYFAWSFQYFYYLRISDSKKVMYYPFMLIKPTGKRWCAWCSKQMYIIRYHFRLRHVLSIHVSWLKLKYIFQIYWIGVELGAIQQVYRLLIHWVTFPIKHSILKLIILYTSQHFNNIYIYNHQGNKLVLNT